ncbi:hypothetical protein BMW23_0782 [Bodo saltans virus]|uniref:Uncharacterized protein n=1 Tax=Bodo saltans virus TaxID=2024608 RepID=A0A2H4UV79_9VIRU|nr:hypothetical protein QJ851_gp0765 [Bodo saltans virus]ATZ80828.1 hypothetical protein BMW23_0782 [Bodo saltans virus]
MSYTLKYNGTFPNNDSIVMSSVFFKLKNMYKSIKIYMEGLERLIKIIKENKYHLILYYDNSVINDNDFLDMYNKYVKDENILFCKYSFPKYQDSDGYHKGTFGTLIRYLPIFSKKIQYKCLYICDVDLTYGELKLYIENCLSLFMESKYKFAALYKIGYEWKYQDLYNIPNTNITILANLMTKKHLKMKKIFFDFLNKINMNDKELVDIKNKKENIRQEKIKNVKQFATHISIDDAVLNAENIKNDTNLFSYGIDELFVNKYLLYNILKKHKIGVFYIYDNLDKFQHKIINFESIPDDQLEKYYKKVFGKYNNLILNSIYDLNDRTFYIQQRNEHIKKLFNLLISILKGLNFVHKNNNLETLLETTRYILKRFIKYTIKYGEKYPTDSSNDWINNLLLHKKKGMFFFMNHKITHKNYNQYDLKKFIKIYSLNKLIEQKRKT